MSVNRKKRKPPAVKVVGPKRYRRVVINPFPEGLRLVLHCYECLRDHPEFSNEPQARVEVATEKVGETRVCLGHAGPLWVKETADGFLFENFVATTAAKIARGVEFAP